MVLFALALLSKESAIFLLPLFVLVVEPEQWRRRLPRLAPHLVLVLLGVASIAQSRSNSFRFTDGSFSLHAPFWITWPHSFARLLWIWGWPAVLVLFVFGDARFRRGALVALAWMGIALVPYSFLTYSTQIPSRQVYLASAGLALLVGLALAQYRGTPDRRRGLRSHAAAQHGVLVDQEARAIRGARGAHGAVDRLRAQHSGGDLDAVFPAAGDRRRGGGAARHGPLAIGSGVECGRGAGTRGSGVLLHGQATDEGILPLDFA